MNVAILGTTQHSQMVAQLIEQHYNQWLENQGIEKLNVVAYVTGGGSTPNIGNIPILNNVQFALLYHKKLIEKIIFPREVFSGWVHIHLKLQELGVKVEDFIIAARLNDEITVFNFLEPYFSAKYLPYFEFHTADHCNMNCLVCCDCSSLVMEPVFPVFEKIVQDFRQLKKFIDDIGQIRILGGEPLLNPEINKYVNFMRMIYPLSDIRICTNGILLPKMSEDFFDTLRKNNIVIDISVYPPMKSKIPAIQKLLFQKGISANFSGVKNYFGKVIQIHPHTHAFEKFLHCTSPVCNMLHDGKFSVCHAPFAFKYFNKYFNQNLPTDGYLDLYDKSLTTEKLKQYISKPIKECSHCGKAQSVKWQTVKHPSSISDWIIDVPEEQ